MTTNGGFAIKHVGRAQLYTWLDSGGRGHVAAFLANVDLSGFDPKAPPPKTRAFWDIVDANRAPEDAELADVLDKIGNPPAVTLGMLHSPLADSEFRSWIQDRKNRRQIPYRLESAGYVAIRNDSAKDGMWMVGGKRSMIYALKAYSVRDQLSAATLLCRAG